MGTLQGENNTVVSRTIRTEIFGKIPRTVPRTVRGILQFIGLIVLLCIIGKETGHCSVQKSKININSLKLNTDVGEIVYNAACIKTITPGAGFEVHIPIQSDGTVNNDRMYTIGKVTIDLIDDKKDNGCSPMLIFAPQNGNDVTIKEIKP